jgi:hypothetical protein
MELRHHPLMRWHKVRNWPPVWTQVRKERKRTVRGELGVLRYVHANRNVSNKCYLVIEHDKEYYVGSLIFDDVTFCWQISCLLQQHIGEPISDIGDLDLSGTL